MNFNALLWVIGLLIGGTLPVFAAEPHSKTDEWEQERTLVLNS